MTRKLSLSFLTCLGASPEDSVQAAAQTGYDALGLRLLPAAPGGIAFPLMDEPKRVASLNALMADLGVLLFDVEMIRIAPDFSPEPFLSFLECAARLGAKVVLIAGDDPDEARLSDSFAKLCEVARPFGLSMDLEFMPQSEVPDLGAAMRVLKSANQSNQGIIVDALHVSRSRTPVSQFADIPAEWLHYAQICDGPAEIPTTREAMEPLTLPQCFAPCPLICRSPSKCRMTFSRRAFQLSNGPRGVKR
jgi:sugar phosphate isomerase/epimerase